MPYLYRHIRLDKNEPFYIGIGSDDGGKYKRAFDKHKRSSFWNKIVSKAGYEVEIILDDLTWDEVCLKEIEFIKLYGRKDLNEGTLCNLTGGGDGMLGVKVSPERIKRFVKAISEPVIQYTLSGEFVKEFITIVAAEKELNINGSQITACCQNKKNKKTAGGYVWRYKDPERWTPPVYSDNTNHPSIYKDQQKALIQYTMQGVFIKEWSSIRQTERETGITRSTITSSCKKPNRSAGGFLWRYKDPEKWFEPVYKIKSDEPDYYFKRAEKNKKPVLQYTLSGELVKEWKSAPDAARDLSLSRTLINLCCNNKRGFSQGFIWKYKDNDNI